MSKFVILDTLLKENQGFLKTSDAVQAGISRAYFGEYVRTRGLERMYVIQVRYPEAVFSHETAMYLLNLADREPLRYSVTLKSGSNTAGLTKQNVKVYKIREPLFQEGILQMDSPAGHLLRVYNPERTLCDLFRSRRNIEIQDLQTAIKEYLRSKEKNIPLLMRYAKAFSVEKTVRQYLEVLL